MVKIMVGKARILTGIRVDGGVDVARQRCDDVKLIDGGAGDERKAMVGTMVVMGRKVDELSNDRGLPSEDERVEAERELWMI